MLTLILSLLGMSLLVGVVVGSEMNSDSEDVDNTASDDEIPIVETPNSILPDLVIPTDEFPDSSDPDIEVAEKDNLIEVADETGLNIPSEVLELIKVNDQIDEIISVDIDASSAGQPTSPLNDWTTEDDVQKFELCDNQAIYLDLDASLVGKFIVQQADYIENVADSDANEQSRYLGANIYFVPEGEEFPSQYIWSNDGASLYNSDTYENNSEDFGGISFVSHIDAGTLESSEGNSEEEAFEQLISRIFSNAELVYIRTT